VITGSRQPMCESTFDRAPIIGQQQVRGDIFDQMHKPPHVARQAVSRESYVPKPCVDMGAKPFAGVEARVKGNNGMPKSFRQRIKHIANADRDTTKPKTGKNMEKVPFLRMWLATIPFPDGRSRPRVQFLHRTGCILMIANEFTKRCCESL
jgi:hypothetical protein